MRVIIEETNNDSENKQRAVLECEADNVTLDTALSLLLRALYAYGYNREDVTNYLMGVFTEADFAKPDTEQPPPTDEPTTPSKTHQALHLPGNE